jgi:SulP family sulfate permease
MAVVILLFATAIGYVAMPALAGLLMLIGFRTIKPERIATVWKTGIVQKAVFVVTFVLTMLIPLQYAVLVGVGVSVILHIVRQSNQVTIKRRQVNEVGDLVETDPPAVVPPGEVVVLQPYGSLFFAAAPVFEAQLPAVLDSSVGSVVILRLRGRSDLGTTFMDVLLRYAQSLDQVGSKLMIASTNEDIEAQLAVTGITSVIGQGSIYRGDDRVGATIRQAESDAQAWVQSHR